MNTHIFISYGHDEFAPKVEVIMKSLNHRKEYQIWWDGDMKKSADWVRQIEDNLDQLVKSKPDSCFIYIVTPYSRSDERYNYCINEILRALEGRVRILPIMLSSAQMPLPIGSLQWYDLTQCEIDINGKDFQNRLEEICKIIDSREPIKIDGRQGSLHNLLRPCQFTLDINKHLQNYCPRQWLLDATLNWLENRNERILLVEGGPGTGKTAFSLWIATREMPEIIHAWHLCQYNDMNTRSLLTCVKSLTWYLASRLPYFYNSLDLSQVEELVQGGEDNSGTMLKELILKKLKETNVTGERIVILIDALDEASENGVNKVAEILTQYVSDMPEWLRFIITTRNDSSVTLPLKDVSYVIDLDDQSNRENCSLDVSAYVKANLDKAIIADNNNIVNLITERSGNVILYAKLMCAAINKGEKLDIFTLPQGLSSYYDGHMGRYFGRGSKYDFETHALPIIHIMLASYQPIKRDYIYRRIHDTEDWCKDKSRFKRVLDCFGPLLKETEEFILPFHKSFSDWLTDSGNHRFYASREDGIEKMCDWGFEVLSDEFVEELDVHFYTYQPQYLIEAKRYKDLLRLYSDIGFWKNRRNILGIDLILQRMLVELSLMNETVRKNLFQKPGFKDVLYYFGTDLFNKGLYIQLKKSGLKIELHDGMGDKERMIALRYYYINGDYSLIGDHLELFNSCYGEKELEPQIQNMLGLATKKCGKITQSETFFRNALRLAVEQHNPLERIIYYHLNLSRVLTILCRFDEGRKELDTAMDAFFHQDWRSGIQTTDVDFSSRQLELAVRYVDVETELFSETYDAEICREEIAWADELYSSKLRRDRYYPRHLQSKVLFMLREHRFDEIDALMDELKESDSAEFDDVRTDYYLSLYQYASGRRTEGLRTAQEQLSKLKKEGTLLIERTELFALVDAMETQSHLAEVSDELKPWYNHTISIIKQIVSR
jgi:hypothetical protein